MSALERRFRRLIALYPVWHRQRYEEEMLGTLMAGASDRQRAPRLRESVDLLWNAISLRFHRQDVPRGRDPRWQDAAGVFGALAALTLSAIYVAHPLGELSWRQRWESFQPQPAIPWFSFALLATAAVCWLLVAVLALIGWRIAAAVLAWATVPTFASRPVGEYADHPQLLVNDWPTIVLGVTIAACLSVPSARSARQLLGGRLVLLFGAVAVATGSSLWLDAKLTKMVAGGQSSGLIGDWGVNYPWIPGTDTAVDYAGTASPLIYAAFLAVVIWVLAKVGAPVRRRLLALAAGPIATAVIVWTAYLNAKYLWDSPPNNGYLHMPPPPTIGQWLLLLLLPLVVLCFGVVLVRFIDTGDDLVPISRRLPGRRRSRGRTT